MSSPYRLTQFLAGRFTEARRSRRWLTVVSLLVINFLGVMLVYGRGAASPFLESDSLFLRVERIFDNGDAGLSNPIALAFVPQPSNSQQGQLLDPGGHFCVLDAAPSRSHELQVVSVEIYGRAGTPGPRVELGTVDIGGVAFDSHRERLLIFDRNTQELIETKCAIGAGVTRHSLAHLGLTNVNGMVFVPELGSTPGGSLFFLDRGSHQLVRSAGASSDIGPGVGPVQAVTRVPLPPALHSATDTHAGSGALAFNLQSRRFYLLNPGGNELFELDVAGRLTATYEIALPDNGGPNNPQFLLAAPSSDLTDSSDTISLYLINAPNPDPASLSATNTIVELTFEPAGEPVPGIQIDFAVLEQTTHTYLYSPPSPDPAGIAYLPQSKTLLVSDSEVNEMPDLFTGTNLFEVALDGTLLVTVSTLSFSDEPTGVAHNPLNNDYFFSDDTGTRGVYHIRPGDDGLYGIGNASVTFSPTGLFGNVDPEGITYDSIQGHLFIVDGVNEEVYELSPGPNQIFDGTEAGGDDSLVNHFDVSRYGIHDPAGIEFDPDSGHLYIMSSDNYLIAETYTDGTLLRYIDISATGARSPAGLAYAPVSGVSNSEPAPATTHSQMSNSVKLTQGEAIHLYIVDRMVDNDSNPDENDGELYTIAVQAYSSPELPTSTPTATQTSSPTSTPTATVAAPTSTPVATASPGTPESGTELHLPIVISQSRH